MINFKYICFPKGDKDETYSKITDHWLIRGICRDSFRLHRLQRWEGDEEILFQRDSFPFEPGESGRHFDPNSPGVRFVVYVDSVQCSTCHLNRMPNYFQYASLETLYPDFQLVAIMWPNAESAPTMAADIAHRAFPFDVFLDKDGSFAAANPSIPSNRDSHCFLLDRDGHPVFTGDPTSTKGKEMLLHNTLYSLYGQK